MDLLKFINDNCGFVEDQEEKEIINFMETYDESKAEFVEVRIYNANSKQVQKRREIL